MLRKTWRWLLSVVRGTENFGSMKQAHSLAQFAESSVGLLVIRIFTFVVVSRVTEFFTSIPNGRSLLITSDREDSSGHGKIGETFSHGMRTYPVVYLCALSGDTQDKVGRS